MRVYERRLKREAKEEQVKQEPELTNSGKKRKQMSLHSMWSKSSLDSEETPVKKEEDGELKEEKEDERQGFS